MAATADRSLKETSHSWRRTWRRSCCGHRSQPASPTSRLDGTPRVIPTWFAWDGTEIVMATYLAGPNAGIRHRAARVAALRANPVIALTIDTEGSPPGA